MFMQDMSACFHDETRAVPVAADPLRQFLSLRQTGLLAATLIETEAGWRLAGHLQAGDRLPTFDGGSCTITGVARRTLVPGQGAGVIQIPGGALGNCADLYLMPDQELLITHPVVEEVLDCCGALVRARDLVGHRAIARLPVSQPLQMITLTLARQELVFANSGVRILLDAGSGRDDGFYPRVTAQQAEAMLTLIELGAWNSAHLVTPSAPSVAV
ncbi:MAG: Hint domain-containing protein [Paracoccaceae bacterium]